MHMQRLRIVPVLAIAAMGSAALAQPGGEGRQGQRAFDPAQFIDRMMENDANGDGKLSREELPGRFAERMFESGDTNGDGLLDRKELEAAAVNMRGGGAQRPGRLAPEGAAPGAQRPVPGAVSVEGEQVSFHDHMEQAGRALRRLRRSEFTSETREDDLGYLQTVQSSIIGAKSKIAEVKMAAAAKEKYGDDHAAYRRDFRMAMVQAMIETLSIETALLEGDAPAARESLNYLLEAQSRAHDIFQADEEEGDAEATRPARTLQRGDRPTPAIRRPDGGG